jgi:hypothetical protein
MRHSDSATLEPVAAVALKLGLTREVVIRKVTRGELRGEQREGRWYAETPAAVAAPK